MSDPPTLTTLPTHILETIIASTDPSAWSLVSRHFAALSSTPYIRSEWLALQASTLPPEVEKVLPELFDNYYGRKIVDCEISVAFPGEDPSWANSFMDDCDHDRWYDGFYPEARNLIPSAPLNPNFLSLATLRIFHSRHPAAFYRLREFLFLRSAYFRNAETTFFCLDHGAHIDYARGWVLARFACDRKVYHGEVVRTLIFKYGARLSWLHHNRGGTNILGAILLYHGDLELARKLIEQSPGLLAENGWRVIDLAVEVDDPKAVKFLLEFEASEDDRREEAEYLVTDAIDQGMGESEVVRVLIEEYGLDIDLERKSNE
ncbi:hypothetical protein BC937DRAFT_87764 [Endogone sp. FLAS-F59071]|nr:hypothetical protein BC937DRAFT_87764 [Endogone sp. FLAS-F59071]|eukprot:RUS19258.1 hypothetical protein BC937DRAFT_87764 [Endogone sp. FLAS-F59071]